MIVKQILPHHNDYYVKISEKYQELFFLFLVFLQYLDRLLHKLQSFVYHSTYLLAVVVFHYLTRMTQRLLAELRLILVYAVQLLKRLDFKILINGLNVLDDVGTNVVVVLKRNVDDVRLLLAL